MSNPQPAANPSVVCLLTADGCHVDSLGKHYVLGVFHNLHAPRFPVRHGQMFLYLSLTDGYGETRMTIRLVPIEDEDSPVFSGELVLTFRNPLDVVDRALPVPGLLLPAPGEYRWQVLCGNEVIHERKLMVTQFPTPPGGPQS